jgi:hypothetical protein
MAHFDAATRGRTAQPWLACFGPLVFESLNAIKNLPNRRTSCHTSDDLESPKLAPDNGARVRDQANENNVAA